RDCVCDFQRGSRVARRQLNRHGSSGRQGLKRTQSTRENQRFSAREAQHFHVANASLARQRFAEAAHRLFFNAKVAGVARKRMLRVPPLADIVYQSAVYLFRWCLYRAGGLDREAVRRRVRHFSECPSWAQQNYGCGEADAESSHESLLIWR